MRAKTIRRVALASLLFSGSFLLGCEMVLDFDRTPLQVEEQKQKDGAATPDADAGRTGDGGGDAGRDARPDAPSDATSPTDASDADV